MAKSMKVGGGGRFAKVKAAAAKSGASDPAAVAAAAGMKKYGKEKMEMMAQAGKKKTMMKKKEMGMKAGNTDYSVNRKSQSSEADGLKEFNETNDPNFPSKSSTFTKVAGTDTSQVQEIPAGVKGKVPKGY